MFKLNYTPSDHPCKLRVPLQVPVLFPPYMSGKLYIPQLDCNTSCMDGQKVGILHDCLQLHFVPTGVDISSPSPMPIVGR